MRWYLPDHYPVFWQEVRRRAMGRRWFVLPLVCLGVVAVLAGAYVLLTIIFGQSLSLDTEGLFMLSYPLKWLIVVVLTPAISAGVISSEREMGSLELLLLTPVTSRQIVAQKYLSVLAPVLLLLLLFVPLDIYLIFSNPFDLHSRAMAVAGFLLTAICYAAVGVYASSLFRSTRMAMVVAYVVIVLGLNILPGMLNIAAMFLFHLFGLFAQGLLLYFSQGFNLGLTFLCLWGSVRALDRLRNPRMS